MERIAGYFDKRCRRQSLNTAIFLVSAFSWCLAISFWMIVKYSSNGDRGGLYLGIAFAVVSLLNVLIGFYSIQAVVRRLVAEVQDSAPEV
ncbi:MAG: hypothetical protein ABSC48_11860 [Terracidiphilus sp.]|jgi:uncharacterized membrane protein (DUF485 family)